MHEVYVEDENGELIDVLPYCSDACARTDENYAGWAGAHETEFTTWCMNCGVVIGGFEPECEHVYPVVVNLIGTPEDEYCEHGTLVRSGGVR
jgi:hypothetical protein